MAKIRGDLKGIEVATNMFITHFLFVDDTLLFGNGKRKEVAKNFTRPVFESY